MLTLFDTDIREYHGSRQNEGSTKDDRTTICIERESRKVHYLLCSINMQQSSGSGLVL